MNELNLFKSENREYYKLRNIAGENPYAIKLICKP
jgi:hypothetical protein